MHKCTVLQTWTTVVDGGKGRNGKSRAVRAEDVVRGVTQQHVVQLAAVRVAGGVTRGSSFNDRTWARLLVRTVCDGVR